MTMELSELQHIENVLTHWQKVERCTFTEEQRQECIDAIIKINQPFEWWQEFLVEVKADVKERYSKVVGMLKDKGLIDQAMHDYEISVIDTFSPAELTRRGKAFAEWYRATPS
jgi:hypothetical protein